MSSDTTPDGPTPTDPEIRAEAEARAARRAEARRRVKAPARPVAMPAGRPHFSQPVRQVVMMLVVLGLVGTGTALVFPRIRAVFETSPVLNGTIGAVFVLGVLTCFWQVVQLIRSVIWIERFAARHRNAEDAAGDDTVPLLLVPLAALLGSRPAGGVISDAAARGMQDSVAARIEEARDITRYLANLLIFLGLLGTFYGLATTVPAVVDTIRSLAPQPDESAMEVFDKLMTGIEGQLGGMATAFSSSLLGLAGSLVVGLLELFVTHGQNRFYRELEEWMTSFTSLAPAGGAAPGDASLSAFTDRMGAQMDALTQFYAERDQLAELDQRAADERALLMARTVETLANDSRAAADEQGELLARLVEAIEASGMARLAEGQQRLVALTEDQSALRGLAAGQAQLIAATQALAERLDETGAAETAALRTLAEGQAHAAEALHTLTARLADGQERLIALAQDRSALREIAEGQNRLIALAERTPADTLHPIAARLAEGQDRLIALAERPAPSDMLQTLALRLSDGQERLIALAEISAEDRAAASAEAATALDEMRARLRSLDQQLARLAEANAEARLTMQAELRADLAALTRAVRRLGLHGHPADHAGDF